MPKDVRFVDGQTWFTTEHAANGLNQEFYIYGWAFTRTLEPTTTDCRNIAGMDENGFPPDYPEGWTSINKAIDEKSCPRQQEPITFNCTEGQVRSSIIAGIYMMRCLKMSSENALYELSESVGRGQRWSEKQRKKIVDWLTMYEKICVASTAESVDKRRRSGRSSGVNAK